MTWTALPRPEQTRVLMPVYVPGRGPVGKRSTLVYRGIVAERDEDGKWSREWTRCGHNHMKRSTAQECAERLARRLNRQKKECDERSARLLAELSELTQGVPAPGPRRHRHTWMRNPS